MKQVITEGGAFPDGDRIIKQARKEVNFFSGSPQRAARLENAREANQLPSIKLENFPYTQVAFIILLLRSLIANEFLLRFHSSDDKDYEKLRGKRKPTDLRIMQEIEAVMLTCFEYAVSDSQYSKTVMNSHYPWYRKILLRSAEKEQYGVMVT